MAVDWNESTVHEEKCIFTSGTFWLGFIAAVLIVSFVSISLYTKTY